MGVEEGGITYYVTDSVGFIHGRWYRGHREPLFKYAVVRNHGCGELGCCSLYSMLDLAKVGLKDAVNAKHNYWSVQLNPGQVEIGQRMYPDAKMFPVTYRMGKW